MKSRLALFALFVFLAPVVAQAASDLRESWAYYISRVKNKASVEEREEILNRILTNPDYSNKDLTLVKNELQRVRTDVAFGESMRYYDAQVKAGIPKEKKIAFLKAIISKYEKRGMDMAKLKTELDKLRRTTTASGKKKKAPTVEVPLESIDEEEPPALPPVESYKSVSLMGGFHAYPGDSYFDSNSDRYSAGDFSGPAIVAGFRQRFSLYGWGVEAGHYGQSKSFSTALTSSTAQTGETELATNFVRASVNYHFLLEDRPWDASVGFGLGPYFYKKTTTETPDTGGASSSTGMIMGFHISGRLSYKFSRKLEVFIEDSYAFASENDSEKIRSLNKDDSINFGGNVIGVGIAYRWWK